MGRRDSFFVETKVLLYSVDSSRVQDALIVAAAGRPGCGWLLSEDFPHARPFGLVTVVNPPSHRPGRRAN